MSSEIIINSLLCFLNTADRDYSQETLTEIVFNFYSHEQIKIAKEEVYNVLKKDLQWRRDPQKKMKDLNDLTGSFLELKSTNRKLKFLADTYNNMPPVGMEFIAPIISNLSSEMNKINEMLPKILDLKSTVINTADTVREMKIDLLNFKSDFSINSLQVHSPRQVHSNIHQKIKALRHNVNPTNRETINKMNNDDNHQNDKPPHDLSSAEKLDQHENSCEGEIKTTFIAAPPVPPLQFQDVEKEDINVDSKSSSNPLNTSENANDGSWIDPNSKKKINKQRKKMKMSNHIMGDKSTPNKLKAARRVVDVFIGRVDKDIKTADIIEYVKETFGIEVLGIEKLDIKSTSHNAFKFSIDFFDREKVFQSNKWPKGIIINKFYNRSKTNSDIK